MGYYVQGPAIGKGPYMVATHNAQKLNAPPRWDAIPAGKGLVVVVNNGPFEAAAFAYDAAEYRDFTDPSDYRSKSYYLMDLPLLKSLTGYNE